MSDSEHSTITYTSVSIPVEDDSDMGSPGVDGPPSPDYVPGPEEPEQAPPSPVYLPYVSEPDIFPNDDDDDDDDEEEDEEEKEHLAPADYTVVALPVVDHVLSEEETEPFETDECAATPPLPPSPLIPYSSPLPQIPSPPPNSPTHIEVPESCLPLRKRLRFAAPTPNHDVGESSAAGAARQDGPAVAREDPYSVARGDLYGFVDRVDVAPRRPMSRELDYGITDTWDDLVRMAREAWGLSMDASDYPRSDVMSLRTTIVGQRALISELQSADHRRQELTKALKLLKGLQTQMA
ncbi:hypothetical protein Tco_1443516 [Tanacetum coccineum]